MSDDNKRDDQFVDDFEETGKPVEPVVPPVPEAEKNRSKAAPKYGDDDGLSVDTSVDTGLKGDFKDSAGNKKSPNDMVSKGKPELQEQQPDDNDNEPEFSDDDDFEVTAEEEAQALREMLEMIDNPPEPNNFVEAQGMLAMYNMMLQQKIGDAEKINIVKTGQTAGSVYMVAKMVPFVGRVTKLVPAWYLAAGLGAFLAGRAVQRYLKDTSIKTLFDKRDDYAQQAYAKFPHHRAHLRVMATVVDRTKFKDQSDDVSDTVKTTVNTVKGVADTVWDIGKKLWKSNKPD